MEQKIINRENAITEFERLIKKLKDEGESKVEYATFEIDKSLLDKSLTKQIRLAYQQKKTNKIIAHVNPYTKKVVKIEIMYGKCECDAGRVCENKKTFERVIIYTDKYYYSYLAKRHTTVGWLCWHPTEEGNDKNIKKMCKDLFNHIASKVNEIFNEKRKQKCMF